MRGSMAVAAIFHGPETRRSTCGRADLAARLVGGGRNDPTLPG
jgi:hypothetical protein